MGVPPLPSRGTQPPARPPLARYRVLIYCPDRHILYDGRTPARRGVGGGITARVRMAAALARRGHRVTVVCNCPQRAAVDGVEYLPLARAGALEADVIVYTTSGGALDVSPALGLRRRARLSLAWVHGVDAPGGLEELDADCVYAVSNFIADVAHERWGLPRRRLFVAYNAFDERLFAHRWPRRPPRRDPHRLVYFSHPSKGLEAARGVLRRLRQSDERFHLVVYGGEALWGGQAAPPPPPEPGLIVHGLTGQRRLLRELQAAAFSIQLQAREEPGALAIVDALRAGCIILASPVGCYPEMVLDGVDGYLITGDHNGASAQSRAAEIVRALASDAEAAAALRGSAQSAPWDSDTMARVWEGHWDWLLAGRPAEALADRCPACGGGRLRLADGLHCTGCARYTPARRETP